MKLSLTCRKRIEKVTNHYDLLLSVAATGEDNTIGLWKISGRDLCLLVPSFILKALTQPVYLEYLLFTSEGIHFI